MESLASLHKSRENQLTEHDLIHHSVKCFSGELDEGCEKCILEQLEIEQDSLGQSAYLDSFTEESVKDLEVTKSAVESFISESRESDDEKIKVVEANQQNKALVAQIEAMTDVTLRKKLLKAMGIKATPKMLFEKFEKQTEKGKQLFIQINCERKGPATKISLEVASLIANNMDEFILFYENLKEEVE